MKFQLKPKTVCINMKRNYLSFQSSVRWSLEKVTVTFFAVVLLNQ